MMKYNIILFDADDTLLDFKKSEKKALENAFIKNNICLTEKIISEYKKINSGLWSEFNKGNIEKEYIVDNRFRMLFEKLDINEDADKIKKDYQYELGYGFFVIDGAIEICKKLSETCDLYCVTNGLAQNQFRRIKGAKLEEYFKDIFVSEEVGFAKPKKEYFDYVLKKISNCHKESILIVGDSLESDIQGGVNAGIDTCWYNPNGYVNNSKVTPKYEIKNLDEILEIIRYKMD